MSSTLCIQHLFQRSFNINLSESHAEKLWKLVRAHLYKGGSRKVIKAVNDAATGALDTYERDIIKDALGQVTAQSQWPCNFTSPEKTHLFFERFYGYLREMKAITDEQDPCLAKIQVLVEVDKKGKTIRVQKRASGIYDIHTKPSESPDSEYVIRHPDSTADDVIRALGHYLNS